MKKYVIILFLLLACSLTGCKKKNITETLFIASIGFEKEEEGYCGYFYLPLSNDIGKTETTENKGKGDYAKVKGKSVAEIFRNINITISLEINFRHVSSIILQEELVKEDFIKELSDFVKHSVDIDFNFYLFATKEKMEDIYSFQNPNEESVINSLLVSTNDSHMTFLVTEPIHFLEFVSKFYANRSISLPLLDLDELWFVDDKPVKNPYCQSAIYYYQGSMKEAIRYPSSPYIKSFKKFEDRVLEEPVSFQDYQFKVKFKDKVYVECSFQYQSLKSDSKLKDEDLNEFVESKILKFIEDFKEIDPFDIAYHNYALSKDLSYDDIEVKVKIAKNRNV
ncbi:MAG: hypothetical protein K2I77_04800 [Anaeroplasmataceae bacterium]|nr:hypothetical protein [Anaeroplasmataceae bacterium]